MKAALNCLVHLSQEEQQKLHELWVRQFSRALGKVPSYIDAVFRVELVGIKGKSFEEAKAEILVSADEILTEFEKHRGEGQIITKLKDYLFAKSKLDIEKKV